MKKPNYRIFTEYHLRSGRCRRYYRKNTKIRVDLFDGFPFFRVPELNQISNWRIADKYRNGDVDTYYLEII